jgi:hypothetical protein
MTTADQIAPTRAHHSSAYARNKALNEELHDRQLHSARRLSGSGPWLLVCECGDEACAETLELSEVEYEAVRSHPRLYAVASGHDLAPRRVSSPRWGAGSRSSSSGRAPCDRGRSFGL